MIIIFNMNSDYNTKPRRLILDCLKKHSGCHMTAEEISEKLSLSGAKVRHILDLGSTHMYITAPGMDEALSRAVNESTEFIKRHISPLEEDA